MKKVTWNHDDPLERSVSEDGVRESKKANLAFRDYANMGAGRSLEKLHRLYIEGQPLPPTTRSNTLHAWSMRFGWVARVHRLDEMQAERAREAYEARRAEIMNSGLAAAHERVRTLAEMAEKLLTDFDTPDKLWLPDVKGIGGAENFQVVELIRFNAGLVSEIRGILDDLAMETGGRVRQTNNSGSIQLVQISADDIAAARQTADNYEAGLLGADESE